MMPSPTKPTESLAMPATSRCLDPQPLTRAQATARLRGQLLAVEQVAPAGARLPARGARRGVPAALGEQGAAHLRQGLQLPYDPVAAAVGAFAARAPAQPVGDDSQG